MAPKRSVAASESQALTRSLLQLRLRLAGFKYASSASLRDCTKAAAELDNCMTIWEARVPSLHLSQVRIWGFLERTFVDAAVAY
jgi:hypothetical protein